MLRAGETTGGVWRLGRVAQDVALIRRGRCRRVVDMCIDMGGRLGGGKGCGAGWIEVRRQDATSGFRVAQRDCCSGNDEISKKWASIG